MDGTKDIFSYSTFTQHLPILLYTFPRSGTGSPPGAPNTQHVGAPVSTGALMDRLKVLQYIDIPH